MTDGTGGEKSKDSQAVWQKWDIWESQLIIAESRWGKKKKRWGSWQGWEQEIWCRIRGNDWLLL